MNGVRFHYEALRGPEDRMPSSTSAKTTRPRRGYAHGEALDVFCYQGGFALHLAKRCPEVTGVDSSRPALEVAEQNAALNGREIEWIEANAFDLLRTTPPPDASTTPSFSTRPPSPRASSNLETALRGYKELNLRALKMLRPGGILVTCSCSYHVSPAEFLEVVADAARDAHRNLRICWKTEARPKTIPILLNVPETSYLKCVIVVRKLIENNTYYVIDNNTLIFYASFALSTSSK